MLIESIPFELEIKDTTDIAKFASYLDKHIEINSEGHLRQKKRFQFYHCEFSI